jgi:hypothetical protein
MFSLALIVGASSARAAIVDTTTLNGSNEIPPNASTATGRALVVLGSDNNTLNVSVTFSGLIGGAAAASHIHCCVSLGNAAIVAVPFPGFPNATSGTYVQSLDLSLAGTYDPNFIANNGGTAASAKAAFIAALRTGKSYINIHNATFPGGEIQGQLAATGTHDFNRDGISDILLENTGGGIAMWLMNGSAAVGSAVGVGSTTPNVWTIIGQRDLNGDGKADILFRANDGSIAEWLMDGATVTSANGLGNPTTAWTIVGTGDFSSDGIGDIVFRGGGTAVAIWYMNSAGGLGSAVGVGSLPVDWTVAGTGDFDGDGVWDILWFNSTSSGVATWLMNANGTIKGAVGIGSLPAGFSIAGTADFNGDGIGDILLSNTGNGVAIWFMNAMGAIASAQTVGTMAAGWTIAQTGDYNGDGKPDILWYNAASGSIATWLLNGATVTGAVGIGSLPPTDWMILSANSE